MNYNKLYSRFIESRTSPIGYCERHHIIPKSLGGNNRLENLIALTPREHFIAHRILAKMYNGIKRFKMIYALDKMLKGSKFIESAHITARTYEYLKIQISKEKSKQWKNVQFKKTTSEKIRQSVLKRWQNVEYRSKHRVGKKAQLDKARPGMIKAWTEKRKNNQLPKLWKKHKIWWSNLSENQKIELRKKIQKR